MGSGGGSSGGTTRQGWVSNLFGAIPGLFAGAGQSGGGSTPAAPPPPVQPQQLSLPGYSDFKVGLFGRMTPDQLAQYDQQNNIITGRGIPRGTLSPLKK